MATKMLAVTLALFVFTVIHASTLEEQEKPQCCEEACANSDSVSESHIGCCKRGCRLFSIIDFIEEFSDYNTTKESCISSCVEAYSGEQEAKEACILGCGSQAQVFAQKFPQSDDMYLYSIGGGMGGAGGGVQLPADMLYPLLYVHNMYSNMFDKMTQSMTVSWSFYIQGNNGQLIVAKAVNPPRGQGEGMMEYKTSNYLETNLEAMDGSATYSHVHQALERDLGGDSSAYTVEEQPTDFLGCISRKTGLSRMLLSVVLFLCALVMVWLCVSSAVSAPTQHIKAQPQPIQQKLSIYGDLEYLRETSEKDREWLLASVHPQDSSSQAPPLPIKLKIGTI